MIKKLGHKEHPECTTDLPFFGLSPALAMPAPDHLSPLNKTKLKVWYLDSEHIHCNSCSTRHQLSLS